MVTIVNARNIIDGVGYNLGGSATAAQRAAAMQFAGSRWMRCQIDGGENAASTAIQAALVSGGYNNPNLKVQILLNGYLAYASTYPWTAVQAPLVLKYATGQTVNGISWKGADGKPIVHAIEGPNEMNSDDLQGGHTAGGEQSCIVDTTTPINNNDSNGGVADPNSDAAFVGWTRAMSTWRSNNATALAGIELLSPTLNGYYFTPWPTDLGISGLVDYGAYHWYTGAPPDNPSIGTGGISQKVLMRAAATAFFGDANHGMVLSEGPIYQPGMSNDSIAMARANTLAIMGFFAAGGHRMLFFELTVDTTNDLGTRYGFGVIMDSDAVTPLPSGYCIHNMMNLLSLNKNYSDPANNTDTAIFTPTYTGTGFSVTGVSPAGDSGTSLIMPKSDGSTMIAVWNEPALVNVTPTANNVTVNFGSTQSYKVYDISGSGGVGHMTPASSTTPYATGTGSSVNVSLYGMPVFIELAAAPPPTQVPGASTVSIGKTTATTQDLSWTTATQSPTDYIITVTEVT